MVYGVEKLVNLHYLVIILEKYPQILGLFTEKYTPNFAHGDANLGFVMR